MRYNANGTLDTTFSADGIVTTGAGIPGINLQGKSVTVQADGMILVGGRTWSSNDESVGDQFVMARYTADGTLDTTFSEDGLVFTDIAVNQNSDYSITVDAYGKIQVGILSLIHI